LVVDPMCMGDPEVSAHTCAPAHRIDIHGGAGEGVKSMHQCAPVQTTGAPENMPVQLIGAHTCVPM
jgi:hypothetical protein